METNVKFLEVYKADDGFRWRALAGNNEIVATGESHTTSHDAKRAAEGVFPGIKVVIEDDDSVV